MKICQWTLLIMQIINLLNYIKRDIEGARAAEPLGFKGVIGSLLAVALTTALLWGAGAFSLLP